MLSLPQVLLSVACVLSCGPAVGTVLAQAPHDEVIAAMTTPNARASAEAGPVIVLRPNIPAYYPGCDNLPEGTDDKLSCATDKLMAYVARELTYPEAAREDNVQGVVIVTFVVTDDGSVTDLTILRDIGYGCGAEAARVLANMPRWEPAIHDGRVVHTQFMLPITFGLRANLYDYALQAGGLREESVTRDEVVTAATEGEWLAFDPQRKPLAITEVVYSLERGGEQSQFVTRGTERPDAKALAKFLGRKPARLTIEANVVDGLDIRTVVRYFDLER